MPGARPPGDPGRRGGAPGAGTAVAPWAWAASSTTGTPASPATARMAAMSTGSPYRWTGSTAAAPATEPASALGSIPPVASSTSTKRARAPAWATASTEAVKVWATVTTSSPGPTPSAASARWTAAVPEATPTARLVPQNPAKAASKAATSGPMMKRPASTTLAIAASSSRCCARYAARTSTSGTVCPLKLTSGLGWFGPGMVASAATGRHQPGASFRGAGAWLGVLDRHPGGSVAVDDLEFRAFFAGQYRRLYALGLLLTGDAAAAEDLAQDALVRTFLVLRYYEDLSEPEVARLLRLPLGTVKSLGRRGLARLRSRLAPSFRPTGGGKE